MKEKLRIKFEDIGGSNKGIYILNNVYNMLIILHLCWCYVYDIYLRVKLCHVFSEAMIKLS